MSRFKNEVAHLQAHVKTCAWLAPRCSSWRCCSASAGGAPKSLTIHATRPALGQHAQVVGRAAGERLRLHVLHLAAGPALADQRRAGLPAQPACAVCVLTPSCRAFLQQDYEFRRSNGELRQRVRGIYEIPGRGYGDDPATRVRTVSANDWIVTLDVSADEYLGAEQVKRALVRYALKVVRMDIDPERNPSAWRWTAMHARPSASNPAAAGAPAGRRPQPAAPSAGRHPMKRSPVGPGRRPAVPGLVPAGHAVEILRWERLPLAVPLVVGQERVVFIDRNVRIGVPAGVGEHLRVQSAGGAIYLRARRSRPRGCNCRTWNPAR
jgi:hypothetical protein